MAVTPADVANTLGRSTPGSGTPLFKQWATWILDARRIIANRLGDLDALDQGNLDYVVREAVAERARNTRTDRASSKTVKVDDAEVTTRWEEGQPSQIDIVDAWWDLLTPNGRDHGAWSIRPYPTRRCWGF